MSIQEFNRTAITAEQYEKLSSKKFWNNFNYRFKKRMSKTRPLSERQSEEDNFLKTGQQKEEKRISKQIIDDELSHANFEELNNSINN